jgi:hypothetical protein
VRNAEEKHGKSVKTESHGTRTYEDHITGLQRSKSPETILAHRNASQGVLDTYCARSMSCVQHHGPGPPGVLANAELGCRELRADDPRKTISIHSLCFTRVTERFQ